MAILDVIKYDGGSDVLVYRHPATDFNTFSRLVVGPSQKAILVSKGRAADVFGSGTYTMHTQNIPLLSKLVNLPFGGESPFSCEVYFVNTAISLNHKWGTREPARVLEKAHGVHLDIGARGSMGLQVTNPAQVMTAVAVRNNELTAEQCLEFMCSAVGMKTTEFISQLMTGEVPEVSDYFYLQNKLSDYSTKLASRIRDYFTEIGVDIFQFVLEAFWIPEDQMARLREGDNIIRETKLNVIQAQGHQEVKDVAAAGELQRQMKAAEAENALHVMTARTENQLKVDQANAEAQATILAAKAEAERILAQGSAETEVMKMQGVTGIDKLKYELLMQYAASGAPQQNPVGILAGIQPAMQFGSAMADQVGAILGGPNSGGSFGYTDGSMTGMPAAGQGMGTGMQFGFGAGIADVTPAQNAAPAQGGGNDMMAELAKLAEMKKQGLLTDEEFSAFKKKLLGM